MSLGHFLGSLIVALKLGGVVSVPGLAALAVALATSRVARSHERKRLDAMGCLWVAHELSRRVGLVLLSTSWGLVGAGLTSVGLNVVAIVGVVVWDSIAPADGADLDMTLLGLLYLGGVSLGFLVFFAFALNLLVRWLKPTEAPEKSAPLPDQ